MKAFTIRVEKNHLKNAISALKKAAKTGVPDIHEHELVCGSVESMLKVLSRSKFEAFAAIVEHKPRSLLELAEILGKDPGNVNRDVQSLDILRLVELKEEKDGERIRIRPIAKYEQIIFDFKAGNKASSL